MKVRQRGLMAALLMASLVVAPMAEAKRAGARTLEFNLQPSLQRGHFADGCYGPAGELLPRWVDALLRSPLSWAQTLPL